MCSRELCVYSRLQSHPQLESCFSEKILTAGGSHIICISTKGAGTNCFDTVRHMWTHVGEWALPFHGKVEYVPELKLWFGMSAKDGQLAAADLSTILSTTDSQPQLVGA
jgi:hypothetical protein